MNRVNVEKVIDYTKVLKDNEVLQNMDKILRNENTNLKLEIGRLNNIINKIDKLFDVDTHCENIYHAIGVLLKKPYFEIEMIDNEEILDILGDDKEWVMKKYYKLLKA